MSASTPPDVIAERVANVMVSGAQPEDIVTELLYGVGEALFASPGQAGGI